MSLQAFITLLKYSKCGRSQHFNKAFDVNDVVFLSGKYVNHLQKRERDQEHVRSPHYIWRDNVICGGGYLPCQVQS